jgi:hypothetical protein
MTLPDEAFPRRMMINPATPMPARPNNRQQAAVAAATDRKSTRLNSSHT